MLRLLEVPKATSPADARYHFDEEKVPYTSEVDLEVAGSCPGAGRNEVAGQMANGRVRWRLATLAAIAQQSSPYDIPHTVGDDPWLLARLHATASLPPTSAQYLSAFLIARALSLVSKSQGELLGLGFDTI